MIHPIKMPPAHIGQKFGEHLQDYSQFGLIGHNGIDYPAPLGTPIMAAADGWIIEQTAKETGFGLRITMRFELNDKFYMGVYGHMQRLENPVDFSFNWNNKSHPVKEGDVIGYVNSTGFSTGNHLHFGLYEMSASGATLNSNNGYGGAIDPLPFIGQTMSQVKIAVIHGEGGIFLAAASPEQLKAIGGIFGKDVQVSASGEILNAEINV